MGLTCDVGQSQLTEGQDDGGGTGFSGRHTLLPGQVVPAGVTHELDPFGNRDLDMDLEIQTQQCHFNWTNKSAVRRETEDDTYTPENTLMIM